MAILNPVTGPVATIWNGVASQAWEPLVSVCRNGTLAQLQGIKSGKLVLYENGSSKASAVFGAEAPGCPVAVLNVHDEKFWVRLALFADMVRLFKMKQKLRRLQVGHWSESKLTWKKGFAESYMLGEITSPDLTMFFEVIMPSL